MKIIFIRHGEPDKNAVDIRGFIGQGRDLAPLTKLGVEQAKAASVNPKLAGGQVIISSPYTRALQTAAIISKNTGLDIKIDMDVYEFLSDKTYQVNGEEENHNLHLEFIANKGEYPEGETRKWESITEIIARVKPVMDKYVDMGYEKIIVVTHGGIMRRFVGKADIEYCEVCEVEYNKDFVCYGWV